MNECERPEKIDGIRIQRSRGAETNGELAGVTVVEDRSRVSRSRLVLSGV